MAAVARILLSFIILGGSFSIACTLGGMRERKLVADIAQEQADLTRRYFELPACEVTDKGLKIYIQPPERHSACRMVAGFGKGLKPDTTMYLSGMIYLFATPAE